MTDALRVSFETLKAPESGVAVVLATSGPKLLATAKELDETSKGALSRAVKLSGFKGDSKGAVDLLVPSGLALSRLLIKGVGRPGDQQESDWFGIGGAIRGKLTGRESNTATIVIDSLVRSAEGNANIAAWIAAGAALRSYAFEKYKTKKKNNDDSKHKLEEIRISCRNPKKVQAIFERIDKVREGVFLARDLVNEPANVLTPTRFAEVCKGLEDVGVDVEILDETQMEELGMNALLGVGLGSEQPSYLAIMRWSGGAKASDRPLAFIGKGVCFDTGGISIKPSQGMEDMKGDMGGAACVVGLMHALAARKAKANVIGVVGLVENMPDGRAQRPGDIVTSMSGQTIEILNTDAEGRLVLADALWYTQDRYKPRFMINLATLTGAILIALGKEHAGLFSNNDELCERLSEAGEATGEKVWRLPLGPKYDKLIESKTADMKNIGGRYAGSITAAQFLQRFVNDVPWAHLDVAGTAMAAEKSDVNPSWGSGYGVRLLDRLVSDFYEETGKS